MLKIKKKIVHIDTRKKFFINAPATLVQAYACACNDTMVHTFMFVRDGRNKKKLPSYSLCQYVIWMGDFFNRTRYMATQSRVNGQGQWWDKLFQAIGQGQWCQNCPKHKCDQLTDGLTYIANYRVKLHPKKDTHPFISIIPPPPKNVQMFSCNNPMPHQPPKVQRIQVPRLTLLYVVSFCFLSNFKLIIEQIGLSV